MANLNVHLDDVYWEKFKDLKRLLKCQTNEEAEIKLIDIVQLHLQQKFIKPNLPKLSNQHNDKTSKSSKQL